MVLCGGLQSGGTTLVAWYMLQRADTDGVLDMRNEILRVSFARATRPVLFVKMTVGSFRLEEVNALYSDLGWCTTPFLVVRDVRSAYSSLKAKTYGYNGTTGEEPPLLVRFGRFLSDWRWCRCGGIPILKFEDFLQDPRLELAGLCNELCLEWDEAMVSWPRQLCDIAYTSTLNATFLASLDRGSGVPAILTDKSEVCTQGLSAHELEWLEDTFSEYNDYHGYPSHVPAADDVDSTIQPQFAGTRRHRVQAEIASICRMDDMAEMRRRLAELPTYEDEL
jgi:hypothetical protein